MSKAIRLRARQRFLVRQARLHERCAAIQISIVKRWIIERSDRLASTVAKSFFSAKPQATYVRLGDLPRSQLRSDRPACPKSAGKALAGAEFHGHTTRLNLPILPIRIFLLIYSFGQNITCLKAMSYAF